MVTEREYVHWLLSVPQVGYLRCRILLDQFESAQAVWEATAEDFKKIFGVPEKVIEQIKLSRMSYSFAEQSTFLKYHEIRLVHQTDPEYPASLRLIPDPPHILYLQGQLLSTDEKAIAIVGSRSATNYGFMVTKNLSADLAVQAVTIVSGLAKGIDTIAHEAALAAGGRTVAVLAGGLLHIYPPQNRHLAARIIQHGALLSEFHPLAKTHPGMFPIRNRIISGISRGVLVVEAARKSGSLITVDQALDQNRDVFAVPGPITSPQSQGTNALIRQGARAITGVADILEEYPEWQTNTSRESVFSNSEISADEKKLLEIIGYGGVQAEYLLRSLSLPTGEVHRLLLELELKGMIKQMPGQIYMRCQA